MQAAYEEAQQLERALIALDALTQGGAGQQRSKAGRGLPPESRIACPVVEYWAVLQGGDRLRHRLRAEHYCDVLGLAGVACNRLFDNGVWVQWAETDAGDPARLIHDALGTGSDTFLPEYRPEQILA